VQLEKFIYFMPDTDRFVTDNCPISLKVQSWDRTLLYNVKNLANRLSCNNPFCWDNQLLYYSISFNKL
jgi:hypothetical protein